MGAVFPFVAALLGGLVSQTVIKAFLIRAGVALGISAVTYTGISIAFTAVIGHVQNNMSALPFGVLSFLTQCKVPAAFSVVLSSYTGALTLRGLSNIGAVTKVGISTPGAVFSPGTF